LASAIAAHRNGQQSNLGEIALDAIKQSGGSTVGTCGGGGGAGAGAATQSGLCAHVARSPTISALDGWTAQVQLTLQGVASAGTVYASYAT
jgi:hypothetical protein